MIMNEVGMSYIGSMIVMIVWMINKCAKTIPGTNGGRTCSLIGMGILANIIKILGLSIA